MKIGITGATGQLGRLVVKKIKHRVSPKNLIGLVRSPEKAADLGITVREFDYMKPEKLAGALQGIDHLLLISGNEIGHRKAQHQNIINAARKAGIKWIVYTSLVNADTSTLSLAKEHVETEELLKASGIPHTILRNGWYTENYTSSLLGAVEAGAIIGSAGDGKISSATREDYAEGAAMVLTNEGHEGKVYELAGDVPYTMKDFAAEVSKQTGKIIPYHNLPKDEYAERLKALSVPEHYAHAIASWDFEASNDHLFNDSHDLSKLIGRPTTTLAESIKNALT